MPAPSSDRTTGVNQIQLLHMNTTNFATLALALSIALAGPLAAAPRGKHIIESYPHRHGAQEAGKSAVEHTVLKRIGPASKGYRNPFLKRR